MMDKSQKVLKRQRKHFIIVGVIICAFVLGFIHFVLQDLSPQKASKAHLKIDLPVDNINPQGIWMNKQDEKISQMESENKLLEQKVKYLEEVIQKRKKIDEENLQSKKREQEVWKEEFKIRKEEMLKEVDRRLKEDREWLLKDKPKLSFEERIEPASQSLQSSSDYFSPPKIETEPAIIRLPIREHILIEEPRKFMPVEEVVPAAVSVKALLVSSVDAVCGVYANSDPVPVKLRLLDDAHLPNGVKINLKGSLLIASAYGNISNERVYMRLERLTQVNSKGEAIETDVVGYVSGEDGKFGVQGIVIDRSVKIVKNAAASGFLGGVGQVLQSAVSRHPVDSFNTYSVGTDIAQKGAANGASSAFDMLAEYYIRRAEQVQPVLQVNAGRIVDITFTHGFAKGDLNTKEKLKVIRCTSRGQA